MRPTPVLPLVAAVALLAGPAPAQVALPGWFIAEDVCEAYQSKNRRTNPGDVRTEIDRAYDMIGINKEGGDYYQMRIDGAPVTRDRWVHISCGVHVVRAETGMPPPPPPQAGESTEHLLALSWQPAFCETRPNKPECELLNAGELPAFEGQLAIHGLWPQPNGTFYCGVPGEQVRLDKDGDWRALPAPELDADTRGRLDALMPGTLSALDRHEWIKHGTCHRGAGGADEYYDDTLQLVEAINGSEVGAFLAAQVGAEIRVADLRERFDAAFGPSAGDRVEVICTNDGSRRLVKELRIHLRGTIAPGASVSDLLLAADPVRANCTEGVIDPAGLQ